VAPRAREKDFFARLGIPKTSERNQVKLAYLAIAKQFHPDRFLSPGLSDLAATVKELFAAVNEAYETLSDNKKRAEYLSRTIPGAAGKGGEAGAEAASAARIDFQKGEACVKTRDFAKGRTFLEAAIRADPRAEYQAALAWCILSEPGAKDRGRAKELLEEAAKDPTCDRALHLAGVLAREDKDEARAERMFRAAVRANPRNADAQRELRQIEARRQSKGEERASLKK
jgi:curved DNA-binding protein CbpA